MNLADYLSELLGQHDEVSVPGLGYFVRTRVNARYSESEARFYPPHHQVKFVPQPREDDIFAQYVADKKNISLASSKYFAEKFITKLKEDAAKGKYLFADLGSFQVEQDQLVFKPNERIAADPAFYGYPPVNIYKVGQANLGHIKPHLAETYSAPPATATLAPALPVQPVVQQQYFEEEPEQKRRMSVWLIVLIPVVVVALAIAGIYKFYPEVFEKATAIYDRIIHKTEPAAPVQHELKTDTDRKTTPATDTTKKSGALVTPADTTKPTRFEIIAANARNQQIADAAMRRYRGFGLKPKALNLSEAPGPNIKISVGTYLSNDSAETVRLQLVNQHKILPSSYTLPIKSQ
jgi:nucleoid DNA-binding protein